MEILGDGLGSSPELVPRGNEDERGEQHRIAKGVFAVIGRQQVAEETGGSRSDCESNDVDHKEQDRRCGRSHFGRGEGLSERQRRGLVHESEEGGNHEEDEGEGGLVRGVNHEPKGNRKPHRVCGNAHAKSRVAIAHSVGQRTP